MKTTSISHICLLFSLLFVLTGWVSAEERLESQRQTDMEEGILYNESVYVISNYSVASSSSSETLSLEELVDSEVEGFYFYLRRDTVTQQIMLRHPDGTYSPFSEALVTIRKALEKHPKKLMTLFLDCYVEADWEALFGESGLRDMAWEFNPRQGWPSLKEMFDTGKRMVVFELRRHTNSPIWIHAMRDFVEHLDPAWGYGEERLGPFALRLKRNLSLYTEYKDLAAILGTGSDISSVARRTPLLIESFRKAWIRDGKIPNFILVDRYYSWLSVSLASFRVFNLVYGEVTYRGDWLNYVNWNQLSNQTAGRFCFPVEPGTSLTLSPSAPGYEIEPSQLSVTATKRKNHLPVFKATAVPVDEDLEMFLAFNGELEDISPAQNRVVPEGVELVDDPMRGLVISLENHARVALPPAPALKVRDHDFTVMAWIKIPRYIPEKEDYCVLGSKNNTYQQSLHLLIRNRLPYMGFYNNDVVGRTMIEPGRWYHITWRYNKSNGEQAIFVNGRLDAISFNRPAFLGTDSLYVGFMDFGEPVEYVGLLDNVGIWSRVLSDREIMALCNDLYDLQEGKGFQDWIVIISLLILFFLVGFAVYGLRLWRHRAHVYQQPVPAQPMPAQSQRLPVIEEVAPVEVAVRAEREDVSPSRRNYIRLFGDFYVLDKEGNEITSLFTPKLKQLFLLLLLHSSSGDSGISSSELTRLIWGDGGAERNLKSLRSVSILKLRKILERMERVEILYTANRYMLQLSSAVYCDYLECLDMLREKRIESLSDFERFYSIVQAGEVFKDESFEWLDDYKSYICNSMVDIISHFINRFSIEQEPDRVIQLADQIMLNDPSNEEALLYKIRALMHQGQTKMAHYTYDRFAQLYQELYAETYGTPFEKLASSDGREEI